MGRYVQRISLVPFSTAEMWVGWELEGVEGEIDGLMEANGMSHAALAKMGVSEFQFIPAAYVSEMRLVKKKSAASPSAGSESRQASVSGTRGTNVSRYSDT